MTDLARIDALFFDRTGMDAGRVERLVGDALHGMEHEGDHLDARHLRQRHC